MGKWCEVSECDDSMCECVTKIKPGSRQIHMMQA